MANNAAQLKQLEAQRGQYADGSAERKQISKQIANLRNGLPLNSGIKKPLDLSKPPPGTTTPPPGGTNPPAGDTPPAGDSHPVTGDATKIDPNVITDPTKRMSAEEAQQIISAGQGWGQQLGDKYFANGSMGRLDEEVNPDMLTAIQNLRNEYSKSQVRDPVDSMVLQRRIDGLEGYNAPENAALRSQMVEQANRTKMGAEHDARVNAGRAQISKAALASRLSSIGTQNTQVRAGQERDLLVENVAEKQRRLQALGDYNSSLTNSEFARRNTAATNLTTGEENRQAYQTTAKQYNQGNANAENAGRLGAELSGVGTFAGLTGGIDAEKANQANQDSIIKIIQQQADDARKANEEYLKAIKR